MSRNALIVIGVALLALFAFGRHSSSPATSTAAASVSEPNGNGNGQKPPAFGGSGSVTAHLSVVPTIRSVTVSPGSVDFGNCSGGAGSTVSTKASMGYPNGTCWVGSTGPNANYPITVSYKGLPGNVWVSGSSAVPDDNGTSWSLCNPQGQPACTGGGGKPGKDQYTVSSFAQDVGNYGVLVGSAECDSEFDSGGGCTATPAEFTSQVQREGFKVIGPKMWDDGATSWNVTITWMAAYPSG